MHCGSRSGQERNARNVELLPRYSGHQTVLEMFSYTKLTGFGSTHLTLKIDGSGAD